LTFFLFPGRLDTGKDAAKMHFSALQEKKYLKYFSKALLNFYQSGRALTINKSRT
jgi:hypothetical protein